MFRSMIAKRKPGASSTTMHDVRRWVVAGEDVRRGGLTLAQVLQVDQARRGRCSGLAPTLRRRIAFRSRQRGSALAPQPRRPQPSRTAPVVERTVRVPSETWQRYGGGPDRPGSVATAWRRSLAVAPCSAEALAMSLAAVCSVAAARDSCQGRLLGTTARGLRQAVATEHSAARLELSVSTLSRVCIPSMMLRSGDGEPQDRRAQHATGGGYGALGDEA